MWSRLGLRSHSNCICDRTANSNHRVQELGSDNESEHQGCWRGHLSSKDCHENDPLIFRHVRSARDSNSNGSGVREKKRYLKAKREKASEEWGSSEWLAAEAHQIVDKEFQLEQSRQCPDLSSRLELPCPVLNFLGCFQSTTATHNMAFIALAISLHDSLLRVGYPHMCRCNW